MIKMVKTNMRQYILMETWAGCNKLYKYFVSKFAQVVFVVFVHSNPKPTPTSGAKFLAILEERKDCLISPLN